MSLVLAGTAMAAVDKVILYTVVIIWGTVTYGLVPSTTVYLNLSVKLDSLHESLIDG